MNIISKSITCYLPSHPSVQSDNIQRKKQSSERYSVDWYACEWIPVCILIHTYVLKCWSGKRQFHYLDSAMILEHLYVFLSTAHSYILHSFHAYLFYFSSHKFYLYFGEREREREISWKRVCMCANIQIFVLEFLILFFLLLLLLLSMLKRAFLRSYQVLLMSGHISGSSNIYSVAKSSFSIVRI